MATWIRPAQTAEGVREVRSSRPDTGPATTPELYFVRRLQRLTALRVRTDIDPVQRRLLNHAMYSTFWDCAGLGLRSTAAMILGLPPQQ